MAAARLDQDREEKSSKIRMKIQNRGSGGGGCGGGVLLVGCCALIAAGIGAAFAARRARDRGSGGKSTPGGTRDLVPSVDCKEDPENSREEIIVDCLVGDQLDNRNGHRDGIVQGLVEDGDDGTTQLEIKQKLEGSEIAHVKGFDHREEIPFAIEFHGEETESSSTEGDEGLEEEGTGDTSIESNEEQAWRAGLSLDGVDVARFAIEKNSEESEITYVEGLDQEEAVSSTASSSDHENIIANSEVVTDTRENEVKANMDDDDGTPVEEGTLGTQSISKNTEMVMELGSNIDNGDDVVKALPTSVVASYKQDMEKSEIANIKENQELLEEIGGEESELPNDVGRSIEGSEVIQDSSVETPSRTDDMVGIAQAEELKVEDLEVIQDSSLEPSAEEKSPWQEEEELPSVDLRKIEQLETPTMTDDMVGIAQAEGQIVEDVEVTEDSSLKSNAEEIFPEEEEELPSIDLERIEQVETPMRNNDMVGIEQAEEDQKIEDLEVVQGSSMESSAEETFPEKEEVLPSIDLDKIEVETPKRTDDMIGIEKAEEEHKLEDSEVIQDSSCESNAVEIFPEEEEELPSIDLKKIEQVEPPKSTCDTVGIAQAEEVKKVEEQEVIQDSESSAEEISSGQEEELPSTDLRKIEQVELPKMTDDMVGTEQAEEEQEGEDPAEEIFPKRIGDMVGIEQAEEEHIVEDPEVIQDSSLKSSTEEIFREEEKELPSFDLQKIEQVETPKMTDDMVGIEQAEEELEGECPAEEIFPNKKQELPSFDLQKIELTPKRTDGIEQAEEEHTVEDPEVIQDSSLKSSTEEIFPEEEIELPSIDLQKIEQVETPKATDDMVGIAQAEEEEEEEEVETPKRIGDMVGIEQAEEEHTVEDPEVIQDSSLKSSREEIFPEEEIELPSIDLQKIEQVETPKATDDMVGIAQAEEEEEEEVETPKRIGDMVGIEQAEEEHTEDPEVIQDSSLKSSTEEIFHEEEIELPSIDLQKIEQVETPKATDDMVGIAQAEEKEEEEEVETPKRIGDMVGIEQAEEEHTVEDPEVIQDSSLKSSREEIFPEEEIELPSIDLQKIEQVETPKATDDMVSIAQAEEEEEEVETPKRIGDMVGIEQAEEEHTEDPEVIQDSSLKSSTEEIFHEEEIELPSIDLQKIEQVETPKATDDMVGIAQAEEEEEEEEVETPKRIGDMVGIEQAEEEHTVEDPEVIQDSSLKSSTEEIFPEEEIELPSIVFKKIVQVETPMTTDDMVGIAQAEEEEEEEEVEDMELVQDSSLESSAEEIFLGQGKEAPWIDSKKIEQFESPKSTSDMVGSSFRVFALLLLAMGLALGLLAFAQPDSLYRRSSNHHLPELYHKLSQLLFASYQRAVGDI